MLGFRHILLVLIILMPLMASSQTTLVLPLSGEATDRGVVYNTETAVNLTLHTNGFRLGLDKGRIKTYYKTTYYHFDFGYIRHPKEIRQSVNYQTSLNIANSYVYGKQNSLYVLRGGWGTKRYLSEKARYRGIAVGYNYEFGPTLGLVKPYYLSFARRVDGVTVNEEIRYTPGNEDLFLDDTRIQGRGGFFNGWDDVTFSPGLHGKIGGHFALGAFEEYITALEAGIMVDVFFQEIPIMVLENNRSFFINVYVTLQLGKRK